MENLYAATMMTDFILPNPAKTEPFATANGSVLCGDVG
jgi:hypothetical protein